MIRTLTFGSILAAGTLAAPAQNGFTLMRSVTGNGGGTSAGGEFRVSGTAGETAAGSRVTAGGQFDLAAGFWAGRPAVMWPELTPLLPVPATWYDENLVPYPGTEAKVNVVPWRPGWRVEYSLDLKTWQSVGNIVTESAGQITGVISGIPGLPRIYWRLVRL